MFFKLTFSILGDQFDARAVMLEITDYVEIDLIAIKGELGQYREHNQSYLMFRPKDGELLYCKDLLQYESWFLMFVKKQRFLFERSDIDSIIIDLDVFYMGDQCNISFFSSSFMGTLAKYKIEMAVSVYRLKARQYRSIEKEYESKIKSLLNKNH
jgi:hypothetical protein